MYYNIVFNNVIQPMQAIMLAFRGSPELVAEVDRMARSAGLSRSDYVRRAVEEKNARMLAERVALLSRELTASHRQIADALDAVSGDGLAER
jgi:hypothetical protein